MAEIDIPTGPIDAAPYDAIRGDNGEFAGQEIREDALLQALEGIQLGTHDRRIVSWLAGWEPSTVATVCSWLHRTRERDAA
ncbi:MULTISPECIES: hypothetical protein [unclassified Nonomuraea]|uniref:hypothetical protein n=1 Tax=unclassified Nonomuraea TaxID=2593643 RepID=UPI003405CCAF